MKRYGMTVDIQVEAEDEEKATEIVDKLASEIPGIAETTIMEGPEEIDDELDEKEEN